MAIKVLLPAVASDPDRLARFSREAQLLASLNHSNIAHVHGLEESDDTRALVMEFDEGEPLSARIARGAMPLDEALPVARQIADALEAAHERGIVHRDLKPANIMVMPDGHVKVLDFGLAKAAEDGSPGRVRDWSAGGPWRVSSSGGSAPRWRADGREIFYAGPTSMMAAPVSTDSGFAAGTPVTVGGGAAGQNTFGRFGFIDASRDGRELLFARPATDTAPREPVKVIVNWTPDPSR